MRTFAVTVFLTAAILSAQPPSAKAKAVMQEMGHGEGTLKPGDLAPDFELRIVQSEQSVRLSSFREKRPVALVFGSYT